MATNDEKNGCAEPSTSKTSNHRQLMIKTFGEAAVSFLDVPIAEVNQAIEIIKRANGHRYFIKLNGQGTIKYEAGHTFTVALFNHSRWLGNLKVEDTCIKIGNTIRATSSQVDTRFVTENEERNIHATFKVENRHGALLKRIDVRGHEMKWFSVFSHHKNILMARPNGDWVSEKFIYLTDQLTTQAINNYRRTNGQMVLPATETPVMKRRQLATRSQTQTTEANARNADVVDVVGENALATQLAEDERSHQKRKEDLERGQQQLQAEKIKFEQELDQLKQQVQAETDEITKELAQLRQEESALAARKERLNEERNTLEKEREQETAQERAQLKQEKLEIASHQVRLNEERNMLAKEREEFYQMVKNLPLLPYTAVSASNDN